MHYLGAIGVELWDILGEMAPYLLFGFAVAGALSVLVPRDLVERHLGGRGMWPIVKATLLGIPLPLCSCSVLPVAASLRSHGASRGATTAFLISTPQTGADNIMVVFSLLGPVFAVFSPLAALVEGVLGGAIVAVFEPKGDKAGSDIPPCQGPCCVGNGGGGRIRQALEYGFLTLPRDIAKALVLGVVAAGVIAAFVPDEFLAGFMGAGIIPMLVMLAVGLPLYVCATASVPVAAALIAKGVSPGAALVFLLTGPTTNAAALSTIWRILGGRTAMAYLVIIAVGALGFGLLLDAIFTGIGASAGPYVPYELPAPAKSATALLLVGVLVVGLLPARRVAAVPEAVQAGAERVEFSVKGMTCSHCAESVREALITQPGVGWASVELKAGVARVSGTGLDIEALRSAVERLGYKIAERERTSDI